MAGVIAVPSARGQKRAAQAFLLGLVFIKIDLCECIAFHPLGKPLAGIILGSRLCNPQALRQIRGGEKGPTECKSSALTYR